MKTYSECIKLGTFLERYKYLRIKQKVGDETLADYRFLSQILYCDSRWKKTRREVILRDRGCDLAIPDREIAVVDGFSSDGYDKRKTSFYVHHIEPLTVRDLLEGSSKLFDLENLITTSFDTHQAIHYGTNVLALDFVERRPNDMCPWLL